MRRIIQTTDRQFIKRILEIEDSYETVASDGSPSLEDYVPTGVWFLLIDGSDIAGFVNLQCLNSVLWMPHIVIFKLYRGAGTEEWGKQVVDVMRDKYKARKALVLTPSLAAKKYAERIGFNYITTLESSIKKNGKLLPQYMLEMSVCQ